MKDLKMYQKSNGLVVDKTLSNRYLLIKNQTGVNGIKLM